MSSPNITTEDYEHINQLLDENRNEELCNFIVKQEGVTQMAIKEYCARRAA